MATLPVQKALRKKAEMLRRLAAQVEKEADRIERRITDTRRRNIYLRERNRRLRMSMVHRSEDLTIKALAHPIIRGMLTQFNIHINALRSSDRSRKLVNVRHLTGYMLCKRAGMSTPKAGELLNRDHSSVVHGIRVIERRMENAPAYRATIEGIWRRTQPPLEPSVADKPLLPPPPPPFVAGNEALPPATMTCCGEENE